MTEPVDVVMCTRNREASIAAAVESVLANTHPDFRLTIIDQSTTDATERALEPIGKVDPRLKYVHTVQAGLSRAYNTGIRMTESDIICFTDDDCVVPTDWIDNIVAAFAAEPSGDLLYGNVVALEDGPESRLTPSLVVDKAEKLSREDGFRVFGMGANFAARRRLFDRIGYFDEILGGGGPLKSSQDFDLAYRAYHGGAVTLLRPEVTLRHDGRREEQDWPTLLLNYGHGDGAFYTKHVRCRDPYATWLLARKLASTGAKSAVKRVIYRKKSETAYFRGVLAGMRNSFRFDVDRNARLYVDKSKAA